MILENQLIDILKNTDKANIQSRPGHLVSNAWCLWIVYECDFHAQAKMDFDKKVDFQNTVTYIL